MNFRLDPCFAQLENLALVDVAIGTVVLLLCRADPDPRAI